MSSQAERLIAEAERKDKANAKTKQQQQQHSRHSNSSADRTLGVSGGVKKPRGYNTWTPEQKQLAADKKCVHCKADWTPTHRCLNNKGHQVCLLALPDTHVNDSPTTATTADPAIGSSETCALGSDFVDQDACENVPEPATTAAGTSASQPSTGTEPTLDELIEAYIAFDEYWQYEQNMRVKFVTDSIA